jgi:NAD(P) transhydrogenase subunit alpha
MTIAVLREPDDARVALSPKGAKIISELGVDLLVEKGAGTKAFFPDEAYADYAQLQDRAKLLAQADLLLSIHPLDSSFWSDLKKGAVMIAQLAPFMDDGLADRIRKSGLHALSLDMIPRTTLAQAMDVLSSMAAIAGYRAALEAARLLPRYFPMMITAAGSLRPAKVLVLGAGVAGLQAIATAKRLGAQVEAFDTRAAAKEEVKSLGAKFVEVEGAADDTGAGGYAVEQSEEFLQRQRAEVQARAIQSDVIITTAQVRGRKAPLLVPTSTVEQMRPGSVIIDLASSTGGNCELSQDGKTIVHQGVSILGNANLAADMPQDASELYSNNLVNFLKLLIKEGELNLDLENEIIRGAWFTAPTQETS